MARNDEGDDQFGSRLLSDDATVLNDVLAFYCPEIQRVLINRFLPELNAQDIEDALSIALQRLWERRKEYDPRLGSVRSLFYVIAKNGAIDILKAKARQDALLRKVFDSGHRVEFQREGKSGQGPEDPRREALPHELQLERQVLAKALQDLGAIDRQILIAYAEARGEESWAARVAEEVGMPASTIRVRRGRLMDRLRREVSARREQQPHKELGIRAMNSPDPMPERTERTSRALEEIGRELFTHRNQLEEILDVIRRRIAAASECASAPRWNSPLNFFRQLWNRAVDRQITGDAANREQLANVGSWMREVERGNESLKSAAQLLRERAAYPAGSKRELVALEALDNEQVERTLMGLSQAIRRSMPDAVVDAGQGRIVIHGDTAVWEHGQPDGALPLMQTVRNAVSYHGKIENRGAAEAISHAIVDELQEGNLKLPSFTVEHPRRSDSQHAVYEWRMPVVSSGRMHLPAESEKVPVSEESACRDPWQSTLWELDLRNKNEQVADLLDEAVVRALKRQYVDGGKGSDIDRELSSLIEMVENVTAGQYSRQAIAALLLPFIDSPEPGAAQALEQAFLYLTRELTGSPMVGGAGTGA